MYQYKRVQSIIFFFFNRYEFIQSNIFISVRFWIFDSNPISVSRIHKYMCTQHIHAVVSKKFDECVGALKSIRYEKSICVDIETEIIILLLFSGPRESILLKLRSQHEISTRQNLSRWRFLLGIVWKWNAVFSCYCHF